MEFPSITPAEHVPQDGTGLLARPYQLPPDEFRAHIAACIDAARVVPFEPTSDGDEPVAPAVAPQRQRRRSLTSTLKAARKSGATSAVVDGVVVAFSPAAAAPGESNGNELDQWMAKHAR